MESGKATNGQTINSDSGMRARLVAISLVRGAVQWHRIPFGMLGSLSQPPGPLKTRGGLYNQHLSAEVDNSYRGYSSVSTLSAWPPNVVKELISRTVGLS